jgi:hypothetical protein
MKLHTTNNFKIVNTQQARITYNYENTKVNYLKLIKPYDSVGSAKSTT